MQFYLQWVIDCKMHQGARVNIQWFLEDSGGNCCDKRVCHVLLLLTHAEGFNAPTSVIMSHSEAESEWNIHFYQILSGIWSNLYMQLSPGTVCIPLHLITGWINACVFVKHNVLVSKCFVKEVKTILAMCKDRVCPQSKNAEHDLCSKQYINIFIIFSTINIFSRGLRNK